MRGIRRGDMLIPPRKGLDNFDRRLKDLETKLARVSGRLGRLSTEFRQTPDTEPIQPAAPAVTSRRGNLSVEWEGDPEADLAQVHVSTEQNFGPRAETLIGTIDKAGGKKALTDLPTDEVTRYVRLVAVKGDLESTPSDQTAVVPAKVADSEIIAELVGKILTGGTIRTAAAGARIEMQSSPEPRLYLTTGDTAESAVGLIDLDATSGVFGSVKARFSGPSRSNNSPLALELEDSATNGRLARFVNVSRLEVAEIRPPLIGAWTIVSNGDMTNGWLNFDSATEPVEHRLSVDGTVFLRGRVKSGTVNTAAFTLPAARRPFRDHMFACPAGNDTVSRVDVRSNGVVIVVNGGANAQLWTSLAVSWTVLEHMP